MEIALRPSRSLNVTRSFAYRTHSSRRFTIIYFSVYQPLFQLPESLSPAISNKHLEQSREQTCVHTFKVNYSFKTM